jgi:hypothetical protein
MCSCDFDYDAPSVFNDTKHKARKPHKCSECHRVVAAGETYRRIFGVWDGIAQTHFWCAHCCAGQAAYAALDDCHCYCFGELWSDIDEAAHSAKNFAIYRLFLGARRKWTYRRGPKKGQLVPIPVALVPA